MVWVRRDVIDHLVPTLAKTGNNEVSHGLGHLPLDQVAQSPVQPGLEHCQGGGIHSFSGQPVPVPHHPQSEEFLSYI